MKTGLDRLLSEPELRAPLKGRRVALLAHPASVTEDLTHAIDALVACPDIDITAAFGPQHGMKGDLQDNMMESPDYRDPVHGFSVFSLYGEVRRPKDEWMDTFDVILIDVALSPVAGLRTIAPAGGVPLGSASTTLPTNITAAAAVKSRATSRAKRRTRGVWIMRSSP